MLFVSGVILGILGFIGLMIAIMKIGESWRNDVAGDALRDLQQQGYTQVTHDGVSIFTPAVGKKGNLTFRVGSRTFQVPLYKHSDGEKTRWRMVEEYPTGERRIVSTGEFARQVQDALAAHQGYRNRVQAAKSSTRVLVKEAEVTTSK